MNNVWQYLFTFKDEQYTAAIGTCRAALEIHQDPSILSDRADAYIGTEMYDEGNL